MTPAFLDTQLAAYLSLREALGFQMHAAKILLAEFVAFAKAPRSDRPDRCPACVLEWACQTSADQGLWGSGTAPEHCPQVSRIPPGLSARH